MDKQTQIKEDSSAKTPQLPMGQLFYLLYSNGFRVKPDDYIEMLKITERFGSHSIDDTAKWICPIIATNETEQTRFYNIIEQYKKLSLAETGNVQVIKRFFPRRIKYAIGFGLTALLLLIIFLSLPVTKSKLNETNKERSVEKGKPLLFDASTMLSDHAADTANIQFTWQFDDGRKQEGVRVSHVFNTPGSYLVKRQFSSKSLTLNKKSDSLLVHVCNDLPTLNINLPGAPVLAGEPQTLTATVDAEAGTVSYYQWSINDSSFSTSSPIARQIVFSKSGDYNLACKAVVDSVNSPCTGSDNKIIHVQDDGIHYAAVFSASRPGSYAGKPSLKWWVTLVLLLPATVALLYSLLKRKPKEATLQQGTPATVALNKGPYEIPFGQNDTKFIQQERDLRRTLIQMRYKAEEETLVLNVPGTINAIIRSGGSPQLVFAPLTQQQQYLILIDRSNPKGMLTRLFAYLAKTIADDGIPVTIFYYDKNWVSYNDKHPAGQTLQRLAETYNIATLLIFGKAHELVYNAYPLIEEKYLKELGRWQSKAIITPLPVKDWAAKEKVLQEYIILLPADVLSLQKLIPALREKIKPSNSLPEQPETEQYSLREKDFRNVSELKAYFDNDETMFQWLCAICIYPRIKWEVMVEIGKAILDKYGEPEKLNYSSLLKLCRIPWMQQGVFPQTTRLELLKQLTVDNEICARERLLHMLDYSTSIYGEDGYFFEEEKKRQQLTNRFILHANNHEHYHQYVNSREAFKKLWKNDAILDMPLKKYLDKTNGDDWQTPIKNGNESVGLSAYFQLQEITINKTTRLKKLLAAGTAVLLGGLWAYMGYGGGAPPFALNQNRQQDIPVAIKVIKNFNQCGDTLGNRFDKMDGYFEIDNERIPVTYNANAAMVSFDLPYQRIASGRATLMLSWDTGKSILTPLVFANHLLPDTLTVACLGKNTERKMLLNIRYNDTAGYRDMEGVLTDVLSQYKITALQSDFTDSSRIVYYEPNQKARADSIVQLIKQSLYIDIKEEFIREERTPPAVPILFLNTQTTNEKNEGNTAADESGNYYHSMGDEAFQNKKYMEAIQSYKRAVAVNPKDALAYYQTGISYEMLGSGYSEDAIDAYNEAIRINARDGLYWYRRGSVKYGLKRYAEAIPDFNKVISLNSEDTRRQYANTIYFRGKAYYFIKNLTSACADFKRSADLGVKAGKQDYAAYCNGNTATAPKPDCNRIFTSLKEALSADAAVVCKLDLSKEYMTTVPKQLYGFKNLTQLNLGSNTLPQNEIDKLQKALPACKIIYSPQQQQQQATENEFGYIELDQSGYTDAAGQRLMETVSRLLKAQPRGRIRLTASYATAEEQKKLTGYMNTIVNMFAKIGVNTKTQVEQQISSSPDLRQQQQNAAPNKTMRIRVTGINLNENLKKAS